ncbi:MAG: alpha/beta fold hydrolase [Nanoarchaeota archaeon]|nr:alpha/beta fold hydrolase [Nanoarchaeota archaeon]MBU4300874.1 alpha/beta fold hydrolase [Nanoarchaeota archaeon]MBU4451420.1 alpha/beta fold hydrolase [Nanoarchaeota archaeon]MCG2724506.1 alpha/beta fold hydrolase [archaeon]
MNGYLKGRKFVGLMLAIFLLIVFVRHFNEIIAPFSPSDKWDITEEGLLTYPQNRGAVEFTKTILNDTAQVELSKIVYKSKGENIYALLRVPKTTDARKPAIILLPGAQVTKEGEDGRAAKFAEWGYVTLTLDERGNSGETGGGINSRDEEYATFIDNREPVTHKMVFDVLRAYDFLAERDDVDSKNIIVFGESMGGRFAVMAAAIEPRIKAVVGVSTAGYDSLDNQFQNGDVARFYKAIDPDAYVAKISQRFVLMVHSTNDTVIPIEMAQKTFGYALEPKKFITVDYKTHGWADGMAPMMNEEMKAIFAQ